RFVRLVDGRPVGGTDRAYEARVEVAADGRIASVYSLSRTLALSSEVSILSAAEAWDALQQRQALRVRVGGTLTGQALATSGAPPTDANGRVNGIVGRLSATLYQDSDGSLARIDARLSEWRSEPASFLSSSWSVTLTGPSLRAVTAYDGLRVRVWGHYDAASHSVDVEQYEQADPSEHVQVFLGVITNTVVVGTMRSIFIVSAPTHAGEHFILAGSLRCTKEQEMCLAGAPTDRPVIVEGALGRDTFNGIPILYDLSIASSDAGTGMTENILRRWPRRPLVLTVQDGEPAKLIEVPNPTTAPQPTAAAPNTPPYQPGQRVEGAEGYLYAYITQDENGQTTAIKAGLSVLPLAGNRWGAALSGPALETMAQYDGTRVRVWGTFGCDEHDQPLIEVERFQKLDPAEQVQAWLGRLVTTTIEGRTVLLLQTRQGERFVLASRLLSANGDDPYTTEFGWGKQLVQEGVLRPETFGGYRVIQDWTRFAGNTIEQMTDLTGYQMQPRPFVSKPERLSPALVAHVEQVELIYNADTTATTSASPTLLRPVWRFAGHLTDGRLFEAWVDAVRTVPARITMDTPSSQTQPHWTLSVSETVELKAMLSALSEVQAPGTNWPGDSPKYRGMLLEVGDEAGATQRLRVFNGVVAGTGMFRADPQRQLEHWLLRSGIGWIDNDLYAELSMRHFSVWSNPVLAHTTAVTAYAWVAHRRRT
ncbi:MAG: hypothetical protein M1546_27220, partial [Chloroflexi bacterium]|nr:hypothetical protein [Chloroflexota bacterium]